MAFFKLKFMLLQSTLKSIADFEKSEGYPKDSLLNVMLFETAGTLSPSIKNKYSNAVGLFQFMPLTLKALGYTTLDASKMTVEQQLNLLCRPYLKPYKSKLIATSDWLDFYLAILYPALMGKPDTAFMASNAGKAIYFQNRGLDVDKDGDIQKSDIRQFFHNKVNSIRLDNNLTAFDGQLKKKSIVKTASLLLLFFLALGTLFYGNKKNKKSFFHI